MTTRCIVCGKDVIYTDQREHLRSNHLGPHYFWMDARKFRAEEPSMTVAEVKALTNTSPDYQVYEDRGGTLIPFGDGMNISLANEPHYCAIPPATMQG